MASIFATNEECEYKAGKGVNAIASGATLVDSYLGQVESFINSVCRFNFSDAYTGLNLDVKKLLTEVASNLAAIYMINYDLSGYTTRAEAEVMVNILKNRFDEVIEILKEKATEDYIKGA